MKSYVAAQGDGVVHLGALIVKTGDKTLRCVVSIGDVVNGEPRMSETGVGALTKIQEGVQGGRCFLTEIAKKSRTVARVRATTKSAADGDIVVFLCRTPEIWDACFAALNVDLSSLTSAGRA